METVRPAPVPASSTSSASSTARSRLLRSVTSKLSRNRKTPTTKVSDGDAKGPNSNTKMMQQKQHHQMEYLDDYAAGAASVLITRPQDKPHINMVMAKLQKQQQMLMIDTLRGGEGGAAKDQEAAALLNSVFDRVSAIKAAYKQIQVGQQPYNPAIIQPADLTVVEELQRISKIKHKYYRNKLLQQKQQNKVLLFEQEDEEEDKVYFYSQQHMEEVDTNVSSKPLEAQLRAKKNLVKAYEITAKNLEDDLNQKNEEFASLTQVLEGIEIKNEALKRRLHHPRRYARSDSGSSPSTPPPAASISISSLHTLHLSGLDPTHFLLGLRYAVRAVRDFVGVLVREMTKSGWDLEAAASAIAPCAAAEATDLAFQSYVCMGMFSDFHLGAAFRAPSNDKEEEDSTAASSSADRRRQCFDEFTAALTSDSAKDLARLKRPFAEFCRAKYAAIVRPQMEAAFFAGMDRRAMADADLFVAFAEMARRVWLLHWLFCSFDPEAKPYMFRAPPGARFTEVYMDCAGSSPEGSVVGFTVVPGFRLRRTVFQCKVYLVAPAMSSSEKQAR